MEQSGPARYGWILMFVVGLLCIVFGLYFLAAGTPSDLQLFQSMTGTSWSQFSSTGGTSVFTIGVLRLLGVTTIGVGIYVVFLARNAFRKGERWAWYSLLFLEFFWIYGSVWDALGGGNTWLLSVVLFVLTTAGLLLPFRMFFPRK